MSRSTFTMLLHCMTSNIFSLGDYFVPKVSSLNRSDYLFFCNLFCFQIQCCNTVLLYVILLFGDLFCFIQSSSFFLKHFTRPRILFSLGQLEVILFKHSIISSETDVAQDLVSLLNLASSEGTSASTSVTLNQFSSISLRNGDH